MNQQNVNDEEPSSTINANNYEDDDNSDYGSDDEEEENEEIRQLLYNDVHDINNNNNNNNIITELEDAPTQEHLRRSGNRGMIPAQSNGSTSESTFTPTTRKRCASEMLTTPNATSLPSTNNNNINHNKRMRPNEKVVQHQQQQPHHLPHSNHPVSSPFVYNNQTGIMPNNIQHPNIYPLPLQPPGTPSQHLANLLFGMCTQLVGNRDERKNVF